MDNKDVEAKVQARLQQTPYASSSLQLLSGGNTNFIYAATLDKPLEDGTTLVAWKHGEAFAANWFNFKLTTARCKLEAEALEYLEKLPPAKSSNFTVQTPKIYYFDQETDTQVQECFPNATNLKNYVLNHCPATPGDSPDETLRPQFHELGKALGKWLKSFHEWGRQPEHKHLRTIVSQIKTMQSLKHLVNYEAMVQKVDKYPEILGGVRHMLQEISDQAKKEIEDESQLDVVHGDFWTGNILLPDSPIQDGTSTSIRVVDWEMIQLGLPELDLGQCIAELWQLVLFKQLWYGHWITYGLVEGYGKVSEAFAFRAIVHVATHLISFGEQTPGWGSQEQREALVATGRDTIKAAWEKDRSYFENQPLGCLFGDHLPDR